MLARFVQYLLTPIVDALIVRLQFTLGQPLPAAINVAPDPQFSGDTSGNYFSETIIDYAFLMRNNNTGEVTDINTSGEINFYDQGDGVATFTDFPEKKVDGAFHLWLARYDSSNVGQWQLVADLSGIDSFTDDNSDWYDYFYGPISYSQTFTPGQIPRTVNGVNPDVTTGNVEIDAVSSGLFSSHTSATGTAVHGLGNSSTRNVGTTSGTVAAGDDSRIVGAKDASNLTLGTIANARTTATTNANANTIVQRGSSGEVYVGGLAATGMNFYAGFNTADVITVAGANTTWNHLDPGGGISFQIVGSEVLRVAAAGVTIGGSFISLPDTAAQSLTLMRSFDSVMKLGGTGDVMIFDYLKTSYCDLRYQGASRVYFDSSSVKLGKPTTLPHLVGGTSAPAIAAGSAAGTSPAIAFTGTDLGGKITLTTGTSPVTGTIATVTFNLSYATAPFFSPPAPANAAAAALNGTTHPYFTSTSTTLVLNSGSAALAASTQYIWTFGPMAQ